MRGSIECSGGLKGGLKSGGGLADRRRGSVTLRMVRGVLGSMKRAVVINGLG